MIEKLYLLCQKELLGWCSSMTHDRALAEDLVQEAFLRALKHVELLQELNDGQQKAWMYRTIKNLYVDRIRHNRYETVSEFLPDEGTKSDDFSDIDYSQLLAALPDDEKLFFVMRYLQGYNSAEIGKIFCLSPATVRTKLYSARKKLREALEG